MFAINLKEITYCFIFRKEILTPSTSKHGSEYRWKDMKTSKQISKYIQMHRLKYNTLKYSKKTDMPNLSR